ncbi:MAG TPA: hypothetical protein VKW06_15200 [Candidatus Angelobacter sp.]|nr:hypothetical protein [Candidatus Angelobacter sp.]
MTTTTTAQISAGIAEFWRVARRLYTIYAELDRTFELGMPSCPELQQNVDRSEQEVLDRVRKWFQGIDAKVQVWQLRQLLQSTNLQTEENLRYLIIRHLAKEPKGEADKEKIDFLLVQYFAHCAPHIVTESDIALDSVAKVLEPALGARPSTFPDWSASLDEKLTRMNACRSLEELQDSGGLLEARELKIGSGEHYFEPSLLVAFTRFNFLARRAFFRAMHLDLHAIRALVNELEKMGFSSLDCSVAGLSANESLEQVRHVIHQWKTPFRAPYTGGSSFQQLIHLRLALQNTLDKAQGKPKSAKPNAAVADASAKKPAAAGKVEPPPIPVKVIPADAPAPSAKSAPAKTAAFPPPPKLAAPAPPAAAPKPVPASSPAASDDQDYLQRCVADLSDQLAAMPAKHAPTVTPIHLGGCKLLIASWEAEAFREDTAASHALQRAVGARTILHVCMERHKKNEPTDLSAAMDLAQRQAEEIKEQVAAAKEANNIDSAVNLAATAKRLLALVEEGRKLQK